MKAPSRKLMSFAYGSNEAPAPTRPAARAAFEKAPLGSEPMSIAGWATAAAPSALRRNATWLRSSIAISRA
jgi:hypothetical protein